MNENLPDVHDLDERRQVLWVLVRGKSIEDFDGFTAAQIADYLADRCEIAISRQMVTAILEKERSLGTVAKTRRGRGASFRIMRRGEDEISQVAARALLIDPSRALTSLRVVEEVLRSLKGEIRICDTYVDSKTLDFLAEMKGASTVQLLTENVHDSGRLRRDLAAFQKEHAVPIEIRVSIPGRLHDRYVLHSDGMLLVGASLKDLGKKQSMIVALSPTFGLEVARLFGRAWHNAKKFS
jgi:hypothetical protein